MPDLYACRLPVAGDSPLRFDQVVDAVGRAVAEHSGLTADGSRLGWRTMSSPKGDDCVWALSWRVPDPRDAGTFSETTVKVVVDRGRTSVVVRRGLVVRSSTMGRLQFGLEPPPIVGALLQSVPAEEDGIRLTASPTHVVDGDAVDALASLLLEPTRALPVVVVSLANDLRTPKPLVDPAAVARTFAGVARVVVLDSVAASFSLTKALGRTLSVFNGAVRLYWPGMTTAAEPRHHTLLLPQAMAPDRATTSVRRALVRRLMPVAVVRFSTVAVEARIRAATEGEREVELDRLRRLVEAADGAGEEARTHLVAILEEGERLRRENLRLAEQLAARDEDLRTMVARWIAGSPADDPRRR